MQDSWVKRPGHGQGRRVTELLTAWLLPSCSLPGLSCPKEKKRRQKRSVDFQKAVSEKCELWGPQGGVCLSVLCSPSASCGIEGWEAKGCRWRLDGTVLRPPDGSLGTCWCLQGTVGPRFRPFAPAQPLLASSGPVCFPRGQALLPGRADTVAHGAHL